MSSKPTLDSTVPEGYTTPPFPSLYLLLGPKDVRHPQYLYNVTDIWRFTLYWTLIAFEAAHICAGTYAVVTVWWGSREQRTKLGMGRKKGLGNIGGGQEGGGMNEGLSERGVGGESGREKGKKVQAGMKGTGISGMWVVPVVYAVIAGVEGVLAGSVVGLLLGALYNAGGFHMSTWIPFVWALVSLMVLIMSSFSIQGGL